ncbi:MAG: helix-turn-helix domain-containing protein [Phycisphaeraceae bacterium]|nr:helix-turn-helix domain-containing protein [Phycisphaeraceae bacterium]
MRTQSKSHAAPPTRYVERINLAIDHVVTHLAEPRRLRLNDVSQAAGLSPFHFHRVFQAMVGQTLAEFVKRLRLERALHMMAHGRRPSLTTIALACGFSSSSDFTRCFTQRYGAPPSRFDIKAWREAHSAELEKTIPGSPSRPHLGPLPAPSAAAGDNPDGFTVKIRDLPARTVAYIRVHNPYESEAPVKAVHRLLAWAERHALADGQWLGYQWENPEIVPLKYCRYHAAVEIPASTLDRPGRAASTRRAAGSAAFGGEIGRFRFPPMVVAQVEIRGTIDLELRALQWLYGSWLPTSGYVPDDHPCFEAWIGRPFAHGMEHFELHAQLPVKRG